MVRFKLFLFFLFFFLNNSHYITITSSGFAGTNNKTSPVSQQSVIFALED